MAISPLAGKPAPRNMLLDLAELEVRPGDCPTAGSAQPWRRGSDECPGPGKWKLGVALRRRSNRRPILADPGGVDTSHKPLNQLNPVIPRGAEIMKATQLLHNLGQSIWRNNTMDCEQTIKDRIVQRTGGRIQMLEVEVNEGKVVVRGRACSYHLKQLTVEGVLDVIGPNASRIDINVEVGDV
jgi:hypothetical protein